MVYKKERKKASRKTRARLERWAAGTRRVHTDTSRPSFSTSKQSERIIINKKEEIQMKNIRIKRAAEPSRGKKPTRQGKIKKRQTSQKKRGPVQLPISSGRLQRWWKSIRDWVRVRERKKRRIQSLIKQLQLGRSIEIRSRLIVNISRPLCSILFPSYIIDRLYCTVMYCTYIVDRLALCFFLFSTSSSSSSSSSLFPSCLFCST